MISAFWRDLVRPTSGTASVSLVTSMPRKEFRLSLQSQSYIRRMKVRPDRATSQYPPW